MKKVIAIIITLLLNISFICGCSKTTTKANIYPSIIPNYEKYKEDKKLEILAFWSPPITYTQYSQMVECGFSSVIIDAKYDAIPGSEQLLNAINLCTDVGIKGYPVVLRGSDLTSTFKTDYTGMDGFAGLYTDEPITRAEMDILESNIAVLKEKYPNAEYLTTLTGGNPRGSDFDSYEEYVDYYVKNAGKYADVFLHDCYPLIGHGYESEIEDVWLQSLETISSAGQSANKKYYTFIASMSIKNDSKRRPLENDLRYQAYVDLAYGASGIAYFCYMSPALPPFDAFGMNDYALIEGDYYNLDDYSTYNKTETWYSAQRVNEELLSFDHVYLSYDWIGVMFSPGTNPKTKAGKCFDKATKNLMSYERINSVTSTDDAIVGCFKDSNNYDGFMVVNFADPYNNKDKNIITIDFRDARKAIVYIKGEKNIVELTNGIYEAEYEAGEGRFIIPIA